ncbi:membrane associated rhomboid family serine protease [Desulfomicrobium macestii]|uniref:Membrane associated rhomboid family serine protease n=1 Tax=Desulfomicrobium macestii TaxID=90731 RepID=A0ABR9H0W0_9BACT|nr:rhomboid family intramembrane serine protease [Desulfomicrobium macestii]MBE1424335.1 membrane associated rhomboid family serine protease [Desulfomicrobium macestii]
MIDILPTLALATSKHSPDKATIRAWALVLSSRRFLHRFDKGTLLVAPALAPLAVREIIAYEEENRPRSRPAPLPDNSWVSLLVIAIFLGLTMWFDAQGLGRRISWHVAGRADAGLILEGQWWRCVTALFLHADAGHLLANAGALAVLASLLARRIGSGLTWGLFLLSGGLGNALNAWAQAPDHLSVGASTGVFGLIGVLAGGAGRAERGSRGQVLLLALGFGFSLLAMLGAGEERVDLGAHFFGMCCGLPFGLLVGDWHGATGWKARVGAVCGAAGLALAVWAWTLALENGALAG